MILRDLRTILRRRRWLALLVFVVVANVGLIVAFSQERDYRSTVGLSLLPSKNPTAGYSRNAELFLNTYADGLRDERFSETVSNSLPFAATPQQVRDAVALEPSGDSATLTLSVLWPQAKQAAELAQVAGEVSQSEAFNPDPENFHIKTVREARVPGDPEGAGTVVTILGWLLGALILAVVAALALDRLLKEVREPRDVERVGDVPLAGAVPGGDAMVLVESGDDWQAFQALRTDVLFRLGGSDLHSIAVVGISPASGGSFVTANLAVAVAALESSVLVVDANPQAAGQHRLFGLPNERGLTTLDGDHPVDFVLESPFEGVSVLPAGPDMPVDHVRSSAFLRRLSDIDDGNGLTLIDGPPLDSALDARLPAAAADGILLVVRAGEIDEDGLREAIERLTGFNARLMGIVLTGVSESPPPGRTAQQAMSVPGRPVARVVRDASVEA